MLINFLVRVLQWQRCSYRGRGSGSQPPLPEFGRSVNPIQIRKADYAQNIILPALPWIQKAIYLPQMAFNPQQISW